MPELPTKIAFIARGTLYSSPGGDTVQVDGTARYLRLLGLTVDVYTTDKKIPYDNYDLFHYFNIIRPADILRHTRRTTKPYVVSPIFVDYYPYELQHRKGITGWVTRLAGPYGSEYLKCIARFLKNGESIRSLYYLLHGHRRSIQKVLNDCMALLPNSASEYRRLSAAFSYSGPVFIVPCAVDLATFPPASVQKQDNLVICAGRIEGRKNQLALIEALKGSAYELMIIGSPSPNHKTYYEACKAAADSSVSFISHVSQDELRSYYKRAKVHALPSWFETAGLSSLEAAFCGCNIVVGDTGDVRDYFGVYAEYCDPQSQASIRAAVDRAAAAPAPIPLQQKIEQQYTWARAAAETLVCYHTLLS